MTIERTSVVEGVGSSGEHDGSAELRKMAARFYSDPAEAAELVRLTIVILGSVKADDPNEPRRAVSIMRELVLEKLPGTRLSGAFLYRLARPAPSICVRYHVGPFQAQSMTCW